jgi:hypothetical protein
MCTKCFLRENVVYMLKCYTALIVYAATRGIIYHTTLRIYLNLTTQAVVENMVQVLRYVSMFPFSNFDITCVAEFSQSRRVGWTALRPRFRLSITFTRSLDTNQGAWHLL